MRAFLAVPVEEPGLGEVRALLQQLQHSLPAVRWVGDDSLHVTVHFFGGIDEDTVRRALTAATPVVEETPPFVCTLDELGSFPPRRAPQVLWLGPSHPAEELLQLAQRCRIALAAAGFAVEQRAFRPHCTLGRPRSSFDRSAWSAVMRRTAVEARFTATQLVLYESTTSPRGAVHTPRTALRFGAARHAEHGA